MIPDSVVTYSVEGGLVATAHLYENCVVYIEEVRSVRYTNRKVGGKAHIAQYTLLRIRMQKRLICSQCACRYAVANPAAEEGLVVTQLDLRFNSVWSGGE